MIATISLVKRHFEFLLCLVIFLVFKRYCKRKKVVKYRSGYLKSTISNDTKTVIMCWPAVA